MRNKTSRAEREVRAREAFRMYSDRHTYVSIANRLGITTPTVKKDVEWYMKNRATREEIDGIDRRTSADIRREKAVERRKERERERDVRVRGIIKRLMDGKTVRQVAEEENRAVPTIYSTISNYAKVDPNLVAEYHRKAKTHQFGRYKDLDDIR